MPPTSYRIVFFGTSDFSVPILEKLHALQAFDVIEVITQPDRPVGRHKILNESPVKRVAGTRGIPVFQPEDLRSPETVAHLKALDADAFVVVSYGKILPKAILDLPKSGAINVHASFLPKYRGASPVAGAIIAGEKVTGVTIMLMDEKMDEGPILAFSEDVPIAPHETRQSLREMLQRAAADMIGPTLMEYLGGRIVPKPQDHTKATRTPILKREDGHIDWHASCEEIDRKIRGFYPWPGTYAIWERDGIPLRLVIKKAEIAHPGASCTLDGHPGRVSRASDGSLSVNCGAGCLTVTLLQMQGKKEVSGREFLNGYPGIAHQTLA